MTSKFKVGDKVNAIAFVDCFGVSQPSYPGLTVAKVTKQDCVSMPVYFRVLAYGPGITSFEGAERFFETA